MHLSLYIQMTMGIRGNHNYIGTSREETTKKEKKKKNERERNNKIYRSLIFNYMIL